MQPGMRQRQLARHRAPCRHRAAGRGRECAGRRAPCAPGLEQLSISRRTASSASGSSSVRSSATALRYGPCPAGPPTGAVSYTDEVRVTSTPGRPRSRLQRLVQEGTAVAEVAAEADVRRRGHALTSHPANEGY